MFKNTIYNEIIHIHIILLIFRLIHSIVYYKLLPNLLVSYLILIQKQFTAKLNGFDSTNKYLKQIMTFVYKSKGLSKSMHNSKFTYFSKKIRKYSKL